MKNYAKLIETIIYQPHFKSNLFIFAYHHVQIKQWSKNVWGKKLKHRRTEVISVGSSTRKDGFRNKGKSVYQLRKGRKKSESQHQEMKLTIHPSNPKIYLFKLPRQQLRQLDETTITLHIADILNINIQFYTVLECERFKAALGNLDLE
jgi:hypothetical protein